MYPEVYPYQRRLKLTTLATTITPPADTPLQDIKVPSARPSTLNRNTCATNTYVSPSSTLRLSVRGLVDVRCVLLGEGVQHGARERRERGGIRPDREREGWHGGHDTHVGFVGAALSQGRRLGSDHRGMCIGPGLGDGWWAHVSP